MDDVTESLKQEIQSFPDVNKATLEALMGLFFVMTKFSQINLMNALNIGTEILTKIISSYCNNSDNNPFGRFKFIAGNEHRAKISRIYDSR